MNSLKIAAALRSLADAFEDGATPAQDTVAAEPAPPKQTRGRGRPVKGEETAAAAASAPAQASSTTTPTLASAEPDPFEGPKATLEDVRKALTELKTAKTQEIALSVLKDVGGAANVTDLKPEKYGAVVAAAKAKAAETAPAAEVDPWETPAASEAPPKLATLEDVRAAAIAAGKKTSQDAVQKVVMQFGGKATNPDTGIVGPSLKALPADQYIEVIKAIQALPATK